ncbi:MAG: hypothetical protein A3D31_12160 [Candidatus Fluviicola riflensis]|nr:MAG: hypothetical protein CHH17_16595 [Candidatus Fluviicola riflensis]OGS77739.1 MAG: hypothetical protein A3D31_12160 [Candidatus Fluviicola riflensis]OGS84322.1 MAG: hypothetical protein A3E30_13570 [Fluviicola sp. RIFCSPHIGHO2_12_FULL_43_24]OGS84804.1 MAG: hypothetical protein A2724_09095 [Fluviicola sp. RIFCSPHIGHO2_01_FULL_43_53]
MSTTINILTSAPGKIDLHSMQDVDYWCQQLNCDKNQLAYCIMKVGNSPGAVENFWQMNQDRLRKFFHLIWNER